MALYCVSTPLFVLFSCERPRLRRFACGQSVAHGPILFVHSLLSRPLAIMICVASPRHVCPHPNILISHALLCSPCVLAPCVSLKHSRPPRHSFNTSTCAPSRWVSFDQRMSAWIVLTLARDLEHLLSISPQFTFLTSTLSLAQKLLARSECALCVRLEERQANWIEVWYHTHSGGAAQAVAK